MNDIFKYLVDNCISNDDLVCDDCVNKYETEYGRVCLLVLLDSFYEVDKYFNIQEYKDKNCHNYDCEQCVNYCNDNCYLDEWVGWFEEGER